MTLRVKLEIVPHGVEEEAREIGRLDIFNEHRVDWDHFEYGVIEMTRQTGALHNKRIFHRRDHGAWHLVLQALGTLDIQGP